MRRSEKLQPNVDPNVDPEKSSMSVIESPNPCYPFAHFSRRCAGGPQGLESIFPITTFFSNELANRSAWVVLTNYKSETSGTPIVSAT